MKVVYLILWFFMHRLQTRANHDRTTDCDRNTDCFRCTSRDCKWCPLDKKCCDKSSVCSNHRNSGDNITDSQTCNNKFFQSYNAIAAYEAVLLTAAANTDRSTECLRKTFPTRDYEIVANISVPCDDFLVLYPNCFAYVGVTHSNKTIIVAYRGTLNIKQLIDEALISLFVPKVPFKAGGRVQEYFNNAHNRLYKQVRKNVTLLKSKHPGYMVLVTGHSLGGAMASLASVSLVYENITHSDHLTLYTFGMPRVGNRKYAETHDRLVPNSYRLVHHRDIVPHLPLMTGKKFDGPYHHGQEIFYTEKKMAWNSNFSICTGDESNKCSDGLITKHPCITDFLSCCNDHKYYFGMEVEDYCDKILH